MPSRGERARSARGSRAWRRRRRRASARRRAARSARSHEPLARTAPSAGCRRRASTTGLRRGVRASSVHALEHRRARRALGARAGRSRARDEVGEAGERRCSRSTERPHQQALVLAALGQHRDARRPHRGAAALSAQRLAVDARRCRRRRGSAPKSARASSVRPLPTSPASPTISPRADVRARCPSSAPAARQAARPRARPARRRPAARLAGNVECQRAAEHRRRPAIVGVSADGGRGADQAAVAHHRHGVGDAEHLVEEVGDEHDASCPRPRSSRMIACKLLGLVARQRRGRLVHHDQPRVAGERAQDLDLLLVGGAERRRPRRRRGSAEAGALVELGEAAAQLAAARRSRRRAARCRGRRSRRPSSAGTSASSCAIVAMPSASASRGEWNAHRPRRRRAARPPSGAMTPPMILPSVDLPAPFSPTRPWTRRARRSTRRRRAPARPPKRLLMPRAATRSPSPAGRSTARAWRSAGRGLDRCHGVTRRQAATPRAWPAHHSGERVDVRWRRRCVPTGLSSPGHLDVGSPTGCLRAALIDISAETFASVAGISHGVPNWLAGLDRRRTPPGCRPDDNGRYLVLVQVLDRLLGPRAHEVAS